MIKYTNISYENYNKLLYEIKRKPYCIEYSNGEKRWLVNNKLHRKDGPAIINENGTKAWYINGNCHREDGPAIIYSDGDKFWFLNDIKYTFKNWCNELNKTDEEKVFLRLKYHD